jgi:hypothetical protein
MLRELRVLDSVASLIKFPFECAGYEIGQLVQYMPLVSVLQLCYRILFFSFKVRSRRCIMWHVVVYDLVQLRRIVSHVLAVVADASPAMWCGVGLHRASSRTSCSCRRGWA